MKKELATRCELALMGKVQKCSNNEVQEVFNYLKSACNYAESYNDVDILADRIPEDFEVAFVTTYRLYDMPCIAFLLKYVGSDEEEKLPDPFEEDYGTGCPCAYSYVFNLAGDAQCSELGDVFFKKKSDGCYHIAH